MFTANTADILPFNYYKASPFGTVLFIFGRGEGAETIWYLQLSISEGIIVTVQYAMLFHQFMTLGGLPPN